MVNHSHRGKVVEEYITPGRCGFLASLLEFSIFAMLYFYLGGLDFFGTKCLYGRLTPENLQTVTLSLQRFNQW
jgi:hypothetical protein